MKKLKLTFISNFIQIYGNEFDVFKYEFNYIGILNEIIIFNSPASSTIFVEFGDKQVQNSRWEYVSKAPQGLSQFIGINFPTSVLVKTLKFCLTNKPK